MRVVANGSVTLPASTQQKFATQQQIFGRNAFTCNFVSGAGKMCVINGQQPHSTMKPRKRGQANPESISRGGSNFCLGEERAMKTRGKLGAQFQLGGLEVPPKPVSV